LKMSRRCRAAVVVKAPAVRRAAGRKAASVQASSIQRDERESAETGTGLVLAVTDGFPSWPKLLDPQQYAVPLRALTQVCESRTAPPAATEIHTVGPAPQLTWKAVEAVAPWRNGNRAGFSP